MLSFFSRTLTVTLPNNNAKYQIIKLFCIICFWMMYASELSSSSVYFALSAPFYPSSLCQMIWVLSALNLSLHLPWSCRHCVWILIHIIRKWEILWCPVFCILCSPWFTANDFLFWSLLHTNPAFLLPNQSCFSWH